MKTSLTNLDFKGKDDLEAFHELDQWFLTDLLERGKKQFKLLLEEVDGILRGLREAGLRVVRKRAVWYRTCLGTVRVERTCYQDKDGQYRYLLDELLGMGFHQHTSLRVTGMALGLAVQMTFRRASAVLHDLTAIRLSHQTIHNQLARTADPHLARQDRETRDYLESGVLPRSEGRSVSRLMVEAHGVMLSLQRESARRTEVKLGIAYEGWTKVGADRYRTVGKTCFADTGSGHEQWAGMIVKLQQRYDMGSVTDIIAGGDGATWIREGADDLGARFQLCRYHLNRELCLALGQRREVIRAVREACRQGQADTADTLLAKVGALVDGDEAQRIARLRAYIAENAVGLGDYRLGMGEEGKGLRRLGSIEGNVDKLIVRRMKNQGMNWKLRGIRRLLCIRFLYLEGSLDDQHLHHAKSKLLPVAADTNLKRKMAGALRRNHAAFLQAGLPALTGPHANRDWVRKLRQLSRMPS